MIAALSHCIVWNKSTARKEKRTVASSMHKAILAMFFVISMIWMPSISYAVSEPQGVRWELIFLSPYSGCTNYQYQMANEYDEITAKYFELYKFQNSKYAPTCMSAAKYSSYKQPGDLDLLILVYDYELGRKDLNHYDLGGFYSHTGTDRSTHHSIVFCDCSNFRFSEPTWILSHELSHFILYYDGYDDSIVEDLIHGMGARHDYCTEIGYSQSCKDVSTQIHGTNYFSYVTVMKPYTPAVGKIPMYVDANYTISPTVLVMQKEITKLWLAGKINDTDYVKLLGFVIGDDTKYKTNGSTQVVFADSPDFTDQKKADDMSQWSKEKLSTVFSRIQANQTDSKLEIPGWFKSRAMWWSQDAIWSDKEFLGSAKYLLERMNP